MYKKNYFAIKMVKFKLVINKTNKTNFFENNSIYSSLELNIDNSFKSLKKTLAYPKG